MAYTFDLEFQKHILASLLSDDKFLKSNLDVLKSNNFSDDLLQGIAETSYDFIKKHKVSPSKSAIIKELKENIAPGRKLVEYEEVLEEVFDFFGVNPDYYQSKAVEFARTQAFSDALRKSLELLEEGQLDEITKTVIDASKVGESFNDEKVYDYFKNLKDRAIYYSNLGKKKILTNRIATGFTPIDERIQGGLGMGETGVIVGLPKHGKTTTLINFATNALIQGKKTLYVTLELRKSVISSKFDTKLFGNTIEVIKRKPKSFLEAMKKLQEKVFGKLHIVEYPTKSLTLFKLYSIIEKLNPEVVFIDYATLLKSTIKSDEKRFVLTDIHEGLRHIAGELHVPIWTAHQANRPGFNSRILGMEHISEDINISAICDVAISINQSIEEKRRGKCRLYIMGNRLGASEEVVNCRVNWNTSNMLVAFGEEDEDLGE
jgi:replicative DNA helicase